VLVSFALFVRGQLVAGSAHQQQLIGSTSASGPASSNHPPGQPRRFIDGAAHALTSPFDGVVGSNSQWVDQGVPTAIALVVYGLGLGFAARYTRGLS
jgi:hypothetical protein